jgi:hypothetical protein
MLLPVIANLAKSLTFDTDVGSNKNSFADEGRRSDASKGSNVYGDADRPE